FVTLGNVLGHSPTARLSSWADATARNYAVLRSAVWDSGERAAQAAGGLLVGRPAEKAKEASPFGQALDFQRTKNNQMETLSLIREPLWQQAVWTATLFLSEETDTEPPALAPAFREAEPAGEIFRQWRDEIGIEDSKAILRVVIIRGIDRNRPYAYR